MPTSQNGWSANDRSVIASYTIPGTDQKIAVRKGDVSVILLDLLGWIDANVESIDGGVFDDWGYAERTIRGSSTTLSNHASGTAVDANATQHPLGVRGTWSPAERARINEQLRYYEGCVRWGDNYSGRVDGMHFEIDRGAADCRRVADKIRAGQLGGRPPSEEDELNPTQATQLQKVADQETRVLSAKNHHGNDNDDQLGHSVSAHRFSKESRDIGNQLKEGTTAILGALGRIEERLTALEQKQ